MSAVIPVSLLAAFLFSVSAVLQQRAASRQHDDHEGGLSLMGRLVHSRMWLAGQVSDLFGFFTQAGALKVGSVGVVQPLVTTQLLFAIGLDAIGRRRRLTISEVTGGLAVCGGLALFLSVRAATPANGLPDRYRLFIVAPCVVLVVAALVGVCRHRRVGPVPSAILLGIAAGVLFACSAVLIKLTTFDLFNRGVAATATDWPGYTLALTTSTGVVLEQMAFASGPLQPGMTAMTMANPVVSYALALTAFHSPLPSSGPALAAVFGAAALLATGVGLAGRSADRLHGRQPDSPEPLQAEPTPSRNPATFM